MKKIVHAFFDEYPKDSRIRRYCNLLTEQGYFVYIICLKTRGLPCFEKQSGLRIYRIPLKKRRSSFLRRFAEYVIFQIIATLYVSWLTVRHRPHFFHFHTLPDFLVFSAILPRLFRKKIILDFHELFPEFMMQHKPELTYDSFMIRFLLFLEKASFYFADYRIVFHDPAREILADRIEDKNLIVIMNGVDESELPSFRKQQTDEFKIVYNGTINFNLNLSLVLDALAYIRSIEHNIFTRMAFHLYGTGPDLSTILSKAKELHLNNVYYHGQIEFEKMINALQTASLCVLPPKKDIYSDLYYSLKLTEMIYFRIPVISTRLKTYSYYYPEDCILYFESNNIKELAEKIVFAFKNKEKLQAYTRNAFIAYQNISWNKMSKRYIQLLNSMD
jgi:glycosyltransferase involved in cell wall biosynthesis